MEKNRLSRALFALTDVVSRLRGPNGCPWDALQNDSTVKMYLLEEAYEVLDAIERGSSEDVCKELGDLLFQIVFLSRLADERGDFDLIEVIERVTEKMINRHPHVFGQAKLISAEEVAEHWRKTKETESDAPKSLISRLRNVAVDLPGLLRAHRLSEKASIVDSEMADADRAWDKIEQEIESLKEAVHEPKGERIGEVTGDLLFSLANLARHWGLNAEGLVRGANQKFLDRFTQVEEGLKMLGVEPEKATMDDIRRARENIDRGEGACPDVRKGTVSKRS